MLLALWMHAPAAAVDCVARLDRTALEARVGAAEQAWLDLDQGAFRSDMNDLAGLVVPCMGDLVPPQLSARWHRLMALHLDDLGDAAAADAAIVAAKLDDPSLVLDDRWLGADHHLRVAFDDATSDGSRKVPEPRAGRLAFDGVVGRERPRDRATLVQLFGADGTAEATAWLGPDDPLPAYPAVPRLRNTLIAGSVATAVASAVSYGLAAGAQSRLFTLADDPTVDATTLEAARSRADAFTVGATVCLGAALGSGTAAVLVGQR